MITGAAVSPDRSRVVLRTYAEAYEWDVTDGDVVKAITSGVPRVTPLPDEPQGEAIAYTAGRHRVPHRERRRRAHHHPQVRARQPDRGTARVAVPATRAPAARRTG